jgi:hypothetical protein
MVQFTLTPPSTLFGFDDVQSPHMPGQYSDTCRVNFTIERSTAIAEDAALSATWNALLNQSKSPETIFQTPAYFDFITRAPNKENYQALVLVREHGSQRVIGVVPIRTGRRTLPLQVGSRTMGRLRVQTIALLGSIPLVLQQRNIWDALLAFLFKEFPGHEAIAMQSLPMDSAFHRHLEVSPDIQNQYKLYIKDGWRACHVNPLPSCVSEYHAQFKAKKRYNLNRQIKQLEAHAGHLQLQRLESPEDIPRLMSGLRKIATDHVLESMMDTHKYRELARHQMLLCYALVCGGRTCAVIIGMRFQNTFHVHNIIYDLELSKYSPGASILHLATEDLIQNLQIGLIDYGYGSPEHTKASPHNSRQRGHAFLYRRSWRNYLLFNAYEGFSMAVRCGKQLLALRQQTMAGRAKTACAG